MTWEMRISRTGKREGGEEEGGERGRAGERREERERISYSCM